jgi:hypothetical protein
MLKKNRPNMLRIKYLIKDLSNPDEELLELTIDNNNIRFELTREQLRDYELIYDKFALREYEYFNRGIERPDYFNIQLSKKELETVINEYKIDDKEKDKINQDIYLLLLEIEMRRRDPKSEYYEPPVLSFYDNEVKCNSDKLLQELNKDIKIYKYLKGSD